MRDIQIAYLANHQEYLDLAASWMVSQWQGYRLELNQEAALGTLKSRLHTNELPISWIAFKKGDPVGLVSLKEDEPGLSGRYKDSLWAGSLFAVNDDLEIRSRLKQTVVDTVKRFHGKRLLTFCSRPDSTAWYLNNGAEKLEEVMHLGHLVSLLNIAL